LGIGTEGFTASLDKLSDVGVRAGEAHDIPHLSRASQPLCERSSISRLRERRQSRHDVQRGRGPDNGRQGKGTAFSRDTSDATAPGTTAAGAHGLPSIKLMKNRAETVLARQAIQHALKSMLKDVEFMLSDGTDQCGYIR
jgi:hypothetical protein